MDVVVQPSVPWMSLNDQIKESGLFFPVDPGPSVSAACNRTGFPDRVCRMYAEERVRLELEAWSGRAAGTSSLHVCMKTAVDRLAVGRTLYVMAQ